MLTKKQLEDAARCVNGNINCHECSNKRNRIIQARSFGKGTAIKDVGCMRAIVEAALAYRKKLERLEFVEVGEREGKQGMIPAVLCPSCGEWKEDGHAPDCELAALLGKDR